MSKYIYVFKGEEFEFGVKVRIFFKNLVHQIIFGGNLGPQNLHERSCQTSAKKYFCEG